MKVEWNPTQSLKEAKQRIIEAAVKYCNGNKTRAAELLGISLRGVRNWTNPRTSTNRKRITKKKKKVA